MDGWRIRAIRKVGAFTLATVAASVMTLGVVTYFVTGTLDVGVGLLVAVVVPAMVVPVAGYWHISLAERLREANDKLRTLSETDPLTGTFNRRRFLQVAEQQLALARRHCFPTSVLIIDFDHFKSINDRFGHVAGDRVLKEATTLMQGALRDSDTLARFGGEEFIVLLPHTARGGAALVAQRLLAAVRDHEFRHKNDPVRVTVSVGGATSESSDLPLDALTSRADGLLYRAKQSGRDLALVETLARQAALPLEAEALNGPGPAA